jgi:hypothetical protein
VIGVILFQISANMGIIMFMSVKNMALAIRKWACKGSKRGDESRYREEGFNDLSKIGDQIDTETKFERT